MNRDARPSFIVWTAVIALGVLFAVAWAPGPCSAATGETPGPPITGETPVLRDGPADLAAGQAAMAAGNPDKGLPLLLSAAQALPQSVNAHLELARAYLSLGQLDKALAQYQAVVKLSPDHAEGKRMVEGLTGQAKSFAQKLALARTMMDVQLYAQAEPLLREVIRGPFSPADRAAAYEALAESAVWQRCEENRLSLPVAIEALDANRDGPGESHCRVLAALATITVTPPENLAAATEMLKGCKDLTGVWKLRADWANMLISLTINNAVESSVATGPLLASIPAGAYRQEMLHRLAGFLAGVAKTRADQGDWQTALRIVWPMISGDPAPDFAKLETTKQLKLVGGWIPLKPQSGARDWAIDALAAISRAELAAEGSKARLLGIWLASSHLAQLPSEAGVPYAVEKRLALIDILAGLSRPAADRKKGEPLSAADTIQARIITILETSESINALTTLVFEAVSEEQRQRIVNAIFAQIGRYKNAGDLETGLRTFVSLWISRVKGLGAVPPREMPFIMFPAGPADLQLRIGLAQNYAALGQDEFVKTAASATEQPNLQLNRFDRFAVELFSQAIQKYPSCEGTVIPAAQAIINRYAAADRWAAASEVSDLLFARIDGEVSKWSAASMKLRQAIHDEDILLAAHRKLGDKLAAPIADSLAEAVKLVTASATTQGEPREATRNRAEGLAGELIARYTALDRPDLADAVIAAMTPEKKNLLDDWAIMARANLLEAQSAGPLAAAARQFDGVGKLAIQPQHVAELKLLAELVDKFPTSRFVPVAVDRVVHIAKTYEGFHAFDVAATVLSDFARTHAKLEFAERFEFLRIQMILSKATEAFSNRTAKEKENPPTKLAAEYAVAIDELAGFLKAHPTGPFSPSAEVELIRIARVYGQAGGTGGWSVARDVLKRFAAAVPDFRSPQHLRLLEAATYLGELDKEHGLALLNPPAPVNAPASGRRLSGEGWDLSRGKEWGELPVGDRDDVIHRSLATSGEPSARRGPSGPDSAASSSPGGKQAAVTESRLSALKDELKEIKKEAAELPTPILGREDESGKSALGDYKVSGTPSETVAMIHQAQMEQATRLARMHEYAANQKVPQQQGQKQVDNGGGAGARGIVLPAGAMLSEAEMKRQDTAADAAYAILIELAKRQADDLASGRANVAGQARAQILWLIGFFEGELRANQAVAVIDKFLKDQPTDQARIGLAYQAVSDRVTWAAQRQQSTKAGGAMEKIDQAWIDARHELFEQARKSVDGFVKEYGLAQLLANPAGPAPAAPAAPVAAVIPPAQMAERSAWITKARLLGVSSYEQEADLVAGVSAPRAGGLLARSADELIGLLDKGLAGKEGLDPAVLRPGDFASRLWAIADRLTALGQRSQAIYVLGLLPVRFPTDGLASRAVQRIADLYATDLQAPLQAVETYQEYLSLVGEDESFRARIFTIADQLAGKQRYLEAMHVYTVYAESFPRDGRAPAALAAIGNIHQSNEAWPDAIAAYQRVLDEYPAAPAVPQVKLAIAECDIQLSQWKAARKIYEEYLAQYGGGAAPAPTPQPGQQAGPAVANPALAQARIEILKSLDRYQTLLADKDITRNRDDAQFQIGQICLDRLSNKVKAIEEFAKVVKDFPKSDRAAAALFEIGKAQIGLDRLDDGRATLLKVAADYKDSPLAAQALYRVGQSYEQQAQGLASVTLEKAREVAFEQGQRGAYQEFNKSQSVNLKSQYDRRAQLRMAATSQPALNETLGLNEASGANTYSGAATINAGTLSRQAEQQAETESALEVAHRQDRIHEAYRQAVAAYGRLANYPLSTVTGDSLMRMAVIYETELKDRDAAMKTFAQIVKFFPGTPVAEEAAWKQVKFYEQQGKFKEAVDAYSDFIVTYPASARLADAQYAKAEALEQLGRWVEAIDAYQTFREKFPTHAKAQPAEAQIQWIKAYRK